MIKYLYENFIISLKFAKLYCLFISDCDNRTWDISCRSEVDWLWKWCKVISSSRSDETCQVCHFLVYNSINFIKATLISFIDLEIFQHDLSPKRKEKNNPKFDITEKINSTTIILTYCRFAMINPEILVTKVEVHTQIFDMRECQNMLYEAMK